MWVESSDAERTRAQGDVFADNLNFRDGLSWNWKRGGLLLVAGPHHDPRTSAVSGCPRLAAGAMCTGHKHADVLLTLCCHYFWWERTASGAEGGQGREKKS